MILKNRKVYGVDPFEESKRILLEEEIFDSRQNLVEIINYFQKGGVSGRHLFRFNEQNKIIEEQIYNAEAETTLLIYKYDNDGVPIEVISTIGGKLFQTQSYQKGDNQNIEKMIDSEGNELERVVENYDNELLIAKEFYAEGELVEKHDYTYDQKGLLKTKLATGIIDRGEIFETFFYNSKGKIIQEIRKEDDEVVYEKEFKYDSKFKETIKHTINGDITYELNTYNMDELLVETILENEERQVLTRLMFKNDKYGNVIEERFFNLSGDRGYEESYLKVHELEYGFGSNKYRDLNIK